MPTERESISADAYAEHAHNLVDSVIDSAMKKLEEEYRKDFGSRASSAATQSSASATRERSFVYIPRAESTCSPNIEWLTIEEFTMEKADAKIKEFIKTAWEYQDNWLYCIDYIGCDEMEFDLRHRFRVVWSIPTRRAPVPRATAAVYFTFVVSKIKPKNYPVEVLYVFESNQLVHKPGQSLFREKWLKDIIESKIKMMELVDF